MAEKKKEKELAERGDAVLLLYIDLQKVFFVTVFVNQRLLLQK